MDIHTRLTDGLCGRCKGYNVTFVDMARESGKFHWPVSRPLTPSLVFGEPRPLLFSLHERRIADCTIKRAHWTQGGCTAYHTAAFARLTDLGAAQRYRPGVRRGQLLPVQNPSQQQRLRADGQSVVRSYLDLNTIAYMSIQ